MAKLSADEVRALVEGNLKYAYKLASKFYAIGEPLGLDRPELDQVAAVAMWRRAALLERGACPPGEFARSTHVHVIHRLRRAVARAARRRSFLAAIDLSEYPAEPPAREERADELSDLVDSAVALLPARQRRMVRVRFGLDGKGGRTLLETALRCRTSTASVRRAIAAAGRMIEWCLESGGRNPDRAAALRPAPRIRVI